MQSTTALLLAALAFTVTLGRKLVESETSANLRSIHPNSVYSMMDQHSTKEKSRSKSKYKGKEGVKIFYQTGVSNFLLHVNNSEFCVNMVPLITVGECN